MEAIAKYEQAAKVAEKSLAANPNDAAMQRNVFVSVTLAGKTKRDVERYPESSQRCLAQDIEAGRAQLMRWLRTGNLRVSQDHLFSRAALLTWLNANCVEPRR